MFEPPLQICRFCLYEDTSDREDQPLMNLFEDYATREKVEHCLQLKFDPNDKIPAIICQCCLEKVNYFNDFLELTGKSLKQLRKLYGLERQNSNSSLESQGTERNWMSDERLKTSRTESDFSISYHAKRVNHSHNDNRVQRGQSATTLSTEKQQHVDQTGSGKKRTKAFKNSVGITDHQNQKPTHWKNNAHISKKDSPPSKERQVIECKICKARILKKNFDKHLLRHSDKFKTSPSPAFKAPAPSKNPNKKIVCKICQKTFRTENRLAVHLKKQHESTRIRFSAHKKRRYNNKRNLKMSFINYSRKFKCKFCGNLFRTVKQLHEHMSTHSKGQKKCPKCSKPFLLKKHFDRHVWQCFYGSRQETPKRTSSLPII